MKIKICGMKHPHNTEAVARLQPDFMGFIFYKKSKADIAHIHSLWSISTIAVYIWAILYKKRYIISTNGMINDWSLKQSKFKKKIFMIIIL